MPTADHSNSALNAQIRGVFLFIALVFSESSMNNIQSVRIISASLIGIIMLLMIWSFFKAAKKYGIEEGLDKE